LVCLSSGNEAGKLFSALSEYTGLSSDNEAGWYIGLSSGNEAG
jgi:hypothetical protein